MSMFCNQCQEAKNNEACESIGVCGKTEDTAGLEDLFTLTLQGVALAADTAGVSNREIGRFLTDGLFTCITNVNFDDESLLKAIKEGLKFRNKLVAEHGVDPELHKVISWIPTSDEEILAKAASLQGVDSSENADVRSLRELMIYGLRGLGAYAHHANVLGYEDDGLYSEVIRLLASTCKDLPIEEMIGEVMKSGEVSVTAMALLDKANTETYGHPEVTKVDIGVQKNPGILISGHDLKDLKQLLEQTKDSGVDIYTHGEMLPAHYYPELKKYDNLVANYGSAWWEQAKDFKNFNGPILMTTNCIVEPKKSYKDRIFTTGLVRFEDVPHIDAVDDKKDFSAIIELAKKCEAPKEIETGEIVGGFAHQQVFNLADTVVEAVKTGAVKKFVVMAGCDGRQKERQYYTDVAEQLPQDSIILTAGCAKFRYNKLELGDIGGIPRVLDAGQCNDSYSLALIALKLKEVFELEDINDLPISYDIAWYEQKAVTVLLALLHLGVKGIRLGPTLPAFLSENVAKVLIDTFELKGIGTAEEDIADMMGYSKEAV